MQAVQIVNRTGKPLPRQVEGVLKEIFSTYKRVTVRQEFKAGMSGSAVFLVRPIQADGQAELPAVVKVDYAERIQQEWGAYTRYIRNKLGNMAEIRDKPFLLPGTSWGGLWYPLVGAGNFEVVSLGQYMRDFELKDIEYVLERQLFPTMSSVWSQHRMQADLHLQTRYDAFLPPNIVVECRPIPSGENPIWLRPEQVPQPELKPGDYVQASGFKVTKLYRKRRKLALDVPADTAAFRFQVTNPPDFEFYTVGEIVNTPLTGIVRKTRWTQLRDYVQKSMGADVDLDADRISLAGGRSLPNPLVALPDVLHNFFDARVATIHGDLNLENVLVELDTRKTHLIDFAKSGQNHVLRDFMQLELGVVSRLLPEALATFEPAAVVEFFERLHCAVINDNPAYGPQAPALQRPFTILRTVRRAAHSYLHRPDNWREYYYGLVIYLLGAFKFGDLDELPAAPRPKQTLFWAAATVLNATRATPDCEPFKGVVQAAPQAQPVPDQPEPAAVASELDPRERAHLHSRMVRYFDMDDLRDICFYLGIDHEQLPNDTKSALARGLLMYCDRTNRMDALKAELRNRRSFVDW